MAAMLTEINFCPQCGARIVQAERFGRLRPVCPDCGWIYFADPKVAAAALVERDGQALFVRRANDPLRGLWTLPAGFVDAGEDPAIAVVRECLEETGLVVRVTGLVNVLYGLEHARGAHILIVYRAEVISGDMVAQDDVDRADFFDLKNPPPLAFEATKKILASL